MIIRPLLLRHGRIALPRSAPAIRSWGRCISSEAERRPNPYEGQQHVEAGHANDVVKQDWQFFQHQKAITDHIGSAVGPHYRPHELLSNPPRPKDITLELLMASQAHIGHATSLWHPANAKYIFGVRGGQDPIHIISLDATAAHLRRACKVVRGVTERGGLVLFVGSREGQARAVVTAAEMAQGCHLFSKWIPGSITNGQQILGRCRKKVVDEFDREVEGFDDQLYAKAALKPDLVVCLNPLENYVLLHECGLNNIPTIGIVDTDVNPTWVTYPIPANDDSLRCVQVIAGVLGRAGQEGQQSRLEKARRGVVEYKQIHGLQPPSEEDAEAKAQRQQQDHEQSLLDAVEALEVTEPADDGPDAEPAATASALAEEEERVPDMLELDPSLRTEQHASSTQEEGFLPYERDAPLDAGEQPPETAAAHFDYTPSPGDGAAPTETPQEWGHKEPNEKK